MRTLAPEGRHFLGVRMDRAPAGVGDDDVGAPIGTLDERLPRGGDRSVLAERLQLAAPERVARQADATTVERDLQPDRGHGVDAVPRSDFCPVPRPRRTRTFE